MKRAGIEKISLKPCLVQVKLPSSGLHRARCGNKQSLEPAALGWSCGHLVFRVCLQPSPRPALPPQGCCVARRHARLDGPAQPALHLFLVLCLGHCRLLRPRASGLQTLRGPLLQESNPDPTQGVGATLGPVVGSPDPVLGPGSEPALGGCGEWSSGRGFPPRSDPLIAGITYASFAEAPSSFQRMVEGQLREEASTRVHTDV